MGSGAPPKNPACGGCAPQAASLPASSALSACAQASSPPFFCLCASSFSFYLSLSISLRLCSLSSCGNMLIDGLESRTWLGIPPTSDSDHSVSHSDIIGVPADLRRAFFKAGSRSLLGTRAYLLEQCAPKLLRRFCGRLCFTANAKRVGSIGGGDLQTGRHKFDPVGELFAFFAHTAPSWLE